MRVYGHFGYIVVAAIVLLLGSACGSETRAGGAADVGVVDGGGEDTADEEDGIGTFDTGNDSGTSEDVADEEVDEELGALGDPCEQDEDCESFLCTSFGTDGDFELCTDLCNSDEDCPRDFDCILLENSGSDAAQICVPTDLCIDLDEDGYGIGPGCEGDDCDDENDGINDGAIELCDGVDNDCDGNVDDNPDDTNITCDTGFFGACSEGVTECSGGILSCVARDEATPERCDLRDNDCDGAVDEGEDGEPLSRECYDGDVSLIGIGVCQYGAQICREGGFSACIGQILPTAELCDGLDNDCDGEIDEGLEQRPFYPDADGDNFGDADAETTLACIRPPGFVENDVDCDDTNAEVYPGRSEVPGDGLDGNCDGFEFCFVDEDDDGYRPSAAGTVLSLDDPDCDDPGEALDTDPVGDCNDSNPAVNAGAEEIPGDGFDQNCDGLELCFVDDDGDGFLPDPATTEATDDLFCRDDRLADDTADGGDCDPVRESVYPDAPELCDDLNNDCDDRTDEGNRCYPNGNRCADDIDCTSGFCSDGFCADATGCARPGSCPGRIVQGSGGGRGSAGDFTIEFTAGGFITAPALENDSYRMIIGPAGFRNDP